MTQQNEIWMRITGEPAPSFAQSKTPEQDEADLDAFFAAASQVPDDEYTRSFLAHAKMDLHLQHVTPAEANAA